MKLQPFHDRRALRILLYTLIPSDRECQPVRRGALVHLRNRARRACELFSWRATGLWRGHFSTFEDVIHSNRGDIAIRLGVRRRLERLLAGRPIKIVEVAWGELGAALDATTAPFDLIVLAGGGFLFADSEGRLPQRLIDDLQALQRVSCPVAGISLGLNYLIHHDWSGDFRFHSDHAPIVEQFLQRLDLASVRDKTTQQALLAAAQITVPTVVDPAFLLASMTGTSARLTRKTATPPLAVGINVALHGAHATVINRTLLTALARALHRFASQTPTNFFYFIHSDGERGMVAALRRYGIPLTVVDGDVDTLLDGYRRLDVHISQMLHSAILATSVGVPTLALAYDIKSTGFFDLLGLPRLCHDAENLGEDRVFTAINDLVAERDEIAAHLATRGAELVAEADRFYAQISALVGRGAVSNATSVKQESCL